MEAALAAIRDGKPQKSTRTTCLLIDEALAAIAELGFFDPGAAY